jgi:hypothetical protein
MTQKIKRVKIKSITRLPKKEDVYNMTVEDNHNYCVCNGAIIKNCDALRYGTEELHKFGIRVV